MVPWRAYARVRGARGGRGTVCRGCARRGSVRMISEGVSTRMCASASRSPRAVTVTLGARTAGAALGGAGGAGAAGGAGGGAGGAAAGAGLGAAAAEPPSGSLAPLLELCRAPTTS